MFSNVLRRQATRVVSVSTVRSLRQGVQVQTRWKSDREERSSPCLLAGLLGFLGFGGDSSQKEETDEDILIKQIKHGMIAFQEGDYPKAESLMHIALKTAQDTQNEDGIAFIYDQLANMAFVSGDLMKSERLFKEVIKKLIAKGVPAEANSIIDISLKLALIYAEWKDDEKASLGFNHCINEQKEKLHKGERDDDTMALWGMSHDYYAQFLLQRHHYKEAKSQFQIAYDTCCEVLGEKHPQAIVLLNSLGSVSSMMDDHAQAVTYLEKAVSLSKEIDGEDTPTYLVNLGIAKLKQGLQSEARKACSEAQTLSKKLNQDDTTEKATNCLNAVNGN